MNRKKRHMIDDKISLEDYHKLPSMSAHNLMDAEVNCVIAQYNKAHPTKPTAAMINGTLIHAAIETRDIGELYVIEPPGLNKRTTAGKQELAEFHEANSDKTIITEKQWEMAAGCREAAWSHPEAKKYLECALFERSVFTTINGVDVKARPDLDCLPPWLGGFQTLVDIKSRQKGAANVEKWIKDWWNYGTYIQAGLQMLVWEDSNMPCPEYYYLLVENAEPYQVNMVYLDQELIEISKEKTLDVIQKWKSWLEKGSPSGYGKPQKMSAKPWMRNYELTL
jgi:hypothetical protein